MGKILILAATLLTVACAQPVKQQRASWDTMYYTNQTATGAQANALVGGIRY